jgi:hypothetical protein
MPDLSIVVALNDIFEQKSVIIWLIAAKKFVFQKANKPMTICKLQNY